MQRRRRRLDLPRAPHEDHVDDGDDDEAGRDRPRRRDARHEPREADGSYKAMRERAAIFVNGRGDRVTDRTNEFCAGAVYTPFPELEKMAR